MTIISLEQAIRNAIEVEQSAARFYEELASQAVNEDTRAFFRRLREDELEHARAIEQFGRLLSSSKLPSEASESWKLIETSPVWRHVEGITYDQALEIALESERGAALYYEALASTTASDSVRSFFENLAATEQAHVRQILELMDRDMR